MLQQDDEETEETDDTEETEETSGPPSYVSAEDMTTFYIVLFIAQGFESVSFNVSSTIATTRCGEIGWEMAETVIDEVIPQAKNLEYANFIDSTTFFLAEVDPLAIHCVNSAQEYDIAFDSYIKALTDVNYLILNTLYHTEYLYESSLEINSLIDLGFNGQDSAYYFSLGEEAGKIFYQALYEQVDDFEYPDIEIIYPSDFDDEALEFFS